MARMDEILHGLDDDSKSLILSPSQLNASDPTLVNEKAGEPFKRKGTRLRAAGTSHNAATFTCRLPVEILCDVFALVQTFDDIPWHPHARKTCEWIRISHVCSHWRSTTIGCAALWTFLDFGLPRMLLELFLERSKGSPLSVCCRREAHGHAELLARVLLQVHRIRALVTLTGWKGAALNTLLSEWTGRAPVPEILDLEQRDDESLPQGFLQRGAPNHRHIELHDGRVHWADLPFSSSITTFNLFQSGKDDCRPSSDEFFKVLSLLNTLQELALGHCLPDADQSHPTHRSIPRSTFPSLKTIEVLDSSNQLDYFLSAARSTTSASMCIDFATSPEIIQQSLDNVLGFCGHSPSDVKAPLRELHLLNTEFTMEFEACSSEFASARIRTVSVVFPEDMDVPAHAVLEALAGHLDFEALESLGYECEQFDDFMTSDDWRLFSQLPNLRTVSIKYSEDWEFLLLLQEKKSLTGATRDELFPRLSKIILSSTFFTLDPSDDYTGQCLHPYLKTLCSIMASRSRTAYPILHLQHEFTKAQMALLQSSLPGFDVLSKESLYSLTLNRL